MAYDVGFSMATSAKVVRSCGPSGHLVMMPVNIEPTCHSIVPLLQKKTQLISAKQNAATAAVVQGHGVTLFLLTLP